MSGEAKQYSSRIWLLACLLACVCAWLGQKYSRRRVLYCTVHAPVSSRAVFLSKTRSFRLDSLAPTDRRARSACVCCSWFRSCLWARTKTSEKKEIHPKN